MKHKNFFFAPILALSILSAWQVGICQTVVQNPTSSQTINQPSGTNFNVNGVQSLLWPGVFKIANEVSGTMVFRDLTQNDAWFFITKNAGNSTGQIQFFGGFTNSGSLIPNGAGGGVGKGFIGTTDSPWNTMVANGMVAGEGSFGFVDKGAGQFRIDHPLDPLNKYLQHSFVESPDMKNVYDGVVILDEHGEAWVPLPNWFQALNSDFRYQLTAIGAPGPNLYVAEEISGNKFKIAGGKPGNKVSWQVTGIRQDAFAKAHRIKVEVEKPLSQRGKYLHPEIFEQQPKDALTSSTSGTITGVPE